MRAFYSRKTGRKPSFTSKRQKKILDQPLDVKYILIPFLVLQSYRNHEKSLSGLRRLYFRPFHAI